MLFPRLLPPLCLACILVLSACATTDKAPPGDSGQAAAAREQPSRVPATPVRVGSAKAPTPFADDETRRVVYFAFGETMIDSESADILRQNAQKLKEDPQLVVTLVGHTDNLGSAAYNLAVADKRIEAVSDRLRSLGVPRSQIRRLPVGSEQSSKQACDSEACRRTMRRVELVYERR